MKKETISMQDPYLDIHHCHCQYNYKRISWTAIFTGALVGVGLGFLLNIFGIAIGLSAFTVEPDGMSVIAIGGIIGIFIAVIASMIVAGYAAGYLGRPYSPKRNLGIIYGFTTWSVALLFSAAIMGHLSDYLATYSHAVIGSSIVLSQSIDHNETGMNKVTAPTYNQDREHKTVTKVTTTPHTLACGAFLIFALFFIGAFSTCIGACWGMSSKRID